MADIKTTVSVALGDMLEILKAEAAQGAEDAKQLLEAAGRLSLSAMKLSGVDQLQALESIGHGCKSGLAAIANERKRAIFQNILQNSLGFIMNIAKAGLGMLGKG